jgi:hypothetical protein
LDLNAASQLSLASAIRPVASELLEDAAIASINPEKQKIRASIEFTLLGMNGTKSNETEISYGRVSWQTR